MKDSPHKMNRSLVSAATFAEANDHVSYWENKTPEERLNAACLIINQIFGGTPQTKIDKTVITQRKHSDG